MPAPVQNATSAKYKEPEAQTLSETEPLPNPEIIKDENGNIVQKKYYDEDGRLNYIYFYDKNVKFYKAEYYDVAGRLQKIDYYHNGFLDKSEVYSYDPSGRFMRIRAYNYPTANSNGILMKERYYNKGVLTEVRSYSRFGIENTGTSVLFSISYYKNGKLDRTEQYLHDGQIYYIKYYTADGGTRYEYYKDGKVVSIFCYDKDGKVVRVEYP